MSMTYTWKVTSMKKKDVTNSDGDTLKDAIIQTYWVKTGKDANGDEGEFHGATPLSADSTPSGSFVALADLTESKVLEWIQSYISKQHGYEDHINEQIQKIIDDKAIKELDTTNLPWAS